EGAADRMDALLPLLRDDRLDDVLVELQFLPVGGTQPEEAEGGAILGPCVRDLVGGQLQSDEAIVGHIVVEGPDHPVAIDEWFSLCCRPRLGNVAVAGQVEPEASPALAVMR